jgi:hypothetical protein
MFDLFLKWEGNYSTGMTRLKVCLYELSVEIIERIIDYNVWCRNKSLSVHQVWRKFRWLLIKRIDWSLISSRKAFDRLHHLIIIQKLFFQWNLWIMIKNRTKNMISFRNWRISSTSLFDIEQYSLKWFTKDSSSSFNWTINFIFITNSRIRTKSSGV